VLFIPENLKSYHENTKERNHEILFYLGFRILVIDKYNKLQSGLFPPCPPQGGNPANKMTDNS
jgi:hypothetical protein